MNDATPRMSNLFLQLGLEDSDEQIAKFIGDNQLEADVDLIDAPFWSESQRQFLEEKLASDGAWAMIIDQLNQALHEEGVKRQNS